MPARCIYSRRFPFNFLSLDSSFIRASPTVSTFSPPLLFHKAIQLFILSLARSHCTACRLRVTVAKTNRSETTAMSSSPPSLPAESSRLRSPRYGRAPLPALQLRQQLHGGGRAALRLGRERSAAFGQAGRPAKRSEPEGERTSALSAKSRSAAVGPSGSASSQQRPAARPGSNPTAARAVPGAGAQRRRVSAARSAEKTFDSRFDALRSLGTYRLSRAPARGYPRTGTPHPSHGLQGGLWGLCCRQRPRGETPTLCRC